jgi:DNA-binding response OmpR family regulator
MVLGIVGEALVHYGMKVHSYLEANKAMMFLESPGAPQFDLVISDINMSGMNGFDVINRIKSIKPDLPVVLMTGQASLDYAIRAMRMGAANLFHKPLTLRELVNSVFHLVETHRDIRMAVSSFRGLVSEKVHFRFRSNELDIPGLVRHLKDRLLERGFATSTNVDVIAMAFHEALVNALEHGNLELDSSLKDDVLASKNVFESHYRERLSSPKYASRCIDVQLDITPDRFQMEITDEGPGFNTESTKHITEDLSRKSFGRGLAMIHMVMDEVSHNEKGNQIRLLLKKKG